MVIGKNDTLPVSAPTPVVSVSPVTLTVPGRVVNLEMRVSAPVMGSHPPILLLSHGGGLTNLLSPFRGFSPLVVFGQRTAMYRCSINIQLTQRCFTKEEVFYESGSNSYVG